MLTNKCYSCYYTWRWSVQLLLRYNCYYTWWWSVCTGGRLFTSAQACAPLDRSHLPVCASITTTRLHLRVRAVSRLRAKWQPHLARVCAHAPTACRVCTNAAAAAAAAASCSTTAPAAAATAATWAAAATPVTPVAAISAATVATDAAAAAAAAARTATGCAAAAAAAAPGTTASG